MKRFTVTGLLLFVVGLGAGAPALKEKPSQQDLVGEWEVVAINETGRRRPVTEHARRYLFRPDGGYTFTIGGVEPEFHNRGYVADPAARPARVDLQLDRTDPSRSISPGIYQVDGDTLRMAFAFGHGAPRPEGFEVAVGDPAISYVLTRVRPGKGSAAERSTAPNRAGQK